MTNFNYTLTPNFWNETGNGTLCIPSVPLPSSLNVTEGQHATLQVVTLGANGQALYNCADITFRANVPLLNGSNCQNDPGVSVTLINQETNGTIGSNGSGGSNSSSGGGSKSAAPTSGVNTVALASVVGLAVAFVYGMSM